MDVATPRLRRFALAEASATVEASAVGSEEGVGASVEVTEASEEVSTVALAAAVLVAGIVASAALLMATVVARLTPRAAQATVGVAMVAVLIVIVGIMEVVVDSADVMMTDLVVGIVAVTDPALAATRNLSVTVPDTVAVDIATETVAIAATVAIEAETEATAATAATMIAATTPESVLTRAAQATRESESCAVTNGEGITVDPMVGIFRPLISLFSSSCVPHPPSPARVSRTEDRVFFPHHPLLNSQGTARRKVMLNIIPPAFESGTCLSRECHAPDIFPSALHTQCQDDRQDHGISQAQCAIMAVSHLSGSEKTIT